MKAGLLRQRITLQSVALTPDGAGGATETWSDFATLYARVAPLSAREPFQAHQIASEATHAITLRYYPGVSDKMRVRYGNRTFLIESIVDEDERHRGLLLLCREIARLDFGLPPNIVFHDFEDGTDGPFSVFGDAGPGNFTYPNDPTPRAQGKVGAILYTPAQAGGGGQSSEDGYFHHDMGVGGAFRYGRELWFDFKIYIPDPGSTLKDNHNRKLAEVQGDNAPDLRMTLHRDDYGMLMLSCVDYMQGFSAEIFDFPTGILLPHSQWHRLTGKLVTNSADNVRDGKIFLYKEQAFEPVYQRTRNIGWITDHPNLPGGSRIRQLHIGTQLTVDGGDPVYNESRYFDDIGWSTSMIGLVNPNPLVPLYDEGYSFGQGAAPPYVNLPANVFKMHGSVYPIDNGAGRAGWDIAIGVENNSQAVDPRLAGNNYIAHAWGPGPNFFYHDLPAGPGTYDITLALGSAAGTTFPAVECKDGATVLFSIRDDAGCAAGGFYDANGVKHASAAAWVANNTPRRVTLAGAQLALRFSNPGGLGAGSNRIAHYRAKKVL